VAGSEKKPGWKFWNCARIWTSRFSGRTRPLPGRSTTTCGVFWGISPKGTGLKTLPFWVPSCSGRLLMLPLGSACWSGAVVVVVSPAVVSVVSLGWVVSVVSLGWVVSVVSGAAVVSVVSLGWVVSVVSLGSALSLSSLSATVIVEACCALELDRSRPMKVPLSRATPSPRANSNRDRPGGLDVLMYSSLLLRLTASMRDHWTVIQPCISWRWYLQ
jgi:hypothetical protein